MLDFSCPNFPYVTTKDSKSDILLLL